MKNKGSFIQYSRSTKQQFYALIQAFSIRVKQSKFNHDYCHLSVYCLLKFGSIDNDAQKFLIIQSRSKCNCSIRNPFSKVQEEVLPIMTIRGSGKKETPMQKHLFSIISCSKMLSYAASSCQGQMMVLGAYWFGTNCCYKFWTQKLMQLYISSLNHYKKHSSCFHFCL